MIKIEFLLKKTDTDQKILENITIYNPTKILEKGSLRGMYKCEIYLPDTKELCWMYGISPIDAICLASDFTKTHLQSLIKKGYTISEVENKEPWQLEPLNDNYSQHKLQDWIDKTRNNPNIPQEEKDKILAIMKASFGGEGSPIKDLVNKLI